ncbi:hypothetical protein SAMD00019534_055860 [Acytostelium subglobosum LB1]|uniref:hypothetical protein n=1 Tax=Acytostelium subglobosum LB1 TaxID=1410327 RepID=UPI000644B15A|nr:hypothetical protein SAMD00019534_055860 [Acytostelium subglobosum LB1]GAM22411.1 hypothetical protein SAMD00019534_055860 [Acytostelium subglobosum LB1]|eukprot:XP_012754531.1 hypothetical protein SAMD00019534_055860 [Acytostelium subglobosum LB1]
MRSSLIGVDNAGPDLDLCVAISSHLQPARPPIVWYTMVGNEVDYQPKFQSHQARIINDLERYIDSGDQTLSSAILVRFTIKHKLFDLLLVILNHINVAPTTPSTSTSTSIGAHHLSSTINQQVSVDALKILARQQPLLFNRLAEVGDISFMKHVHHLVADYMTATFDESPSLQIFDRSLLQCALSRGHYDCAVYILDNMTQFLPKRSPLYSTTLVLGRHKWVVTSINMVADPNLADHNWLELVNRILWSKKVQHDLRDLYSDAIRAKQMGVIELIELIISSSHPKDRSAFFRKIDINQTLNIALEEEYLDGIKTIIHNRPFHKFSSISLRFINLCPPEHQDKILALLHPHSLCLYTHLGGNDRLTSTTIKMLIKHGHCNQHVLESHVQSHDGSFFSEYELMEMLYSINIGGDGHDHDGPLSSRNQIDKWLKTSQHTNRRDKFDGQMAVSELFGIKSSKQMSPI